MNALQKIRTLFAHREVAQPIKPSISPTFDLNLASVRPDIPADEIARRAYLIWQERGCGHGNHLEDWTLARIQLEDERN